MPPFDFFLLVISQLFLKNIDRLLQFELLIRMFLCKDLKLLLTHYYRFLSTFKKILFLFVKEILCWTLPILESVSLFKIIFFVQSLVEGISIKIDADVYHFFLLFWLLNSHLIGFASFDQSRVVEDQ